MTAANRQLQAAQWLKPCLHVTELRPETANHAESMVRTVSSAGRHVSRLVISFTGAAVSLRPALQPQLMLSMAMLRRHGAYAVSGYAALALSYVMAVGMAYSL